MKPNPTPTLPKDLKFGDVFTVSVAPMHPWEFIVVKAHNKTEVTGFRPYVTMNQVTALIGVEVLVLFKSDTRPVYVWDRASGTEGNIYD